MSPAYSREHERHTDARRFPHRFSSTGSGSFSVSYETRLPD
jgi:hypothetical protein